MQTIKFIIHISLFGFACGSMLSTGMGLTIEQIKLHLKLTRLSVAAIVFSFILSPLLAIALINIFKLNAHLGTGLIILSVVAGGEFLSRLAGLGHCDPVPTKGLTILLMLVTIAFAPLVLPYLLQGVSVNAWAIIKPLIYSMVIPLGIGIFVRNRYADIAIKLKPAISVISNIFMGLMMVLTLILHWNLLMNFRSDVLFSALIFILVLFFIPYLLFIKDKDNRLLIGLSASQRNLGAAATIAAVSFNNQPKILLMILTESFFSLIILFVFAKMGNRATNKLNKT
jgi:BASS family bile acid:Na+ symporter